MDFGHYRIIIILGNTRKPNITNTTDLDVGWFSNVPRAV